MTRAEKWSRISLYALPLLFLIQAFAFSLRLDFQQFHNDFWDVVFVSRTMAWEDRQSWFNPQYPMGYSLFLKGIMGEGLPTVSAIAANILFGAALLGLCAYYFHKWLGPLFALLPLAALALFPEFWRYAQAGGGDPGALFFFALGALILLAATSRPAENIPKARVFLLAGISLGLAGLFRYHALVAGGMLLPALFLAYPRRWKFLAWAAGGLALGYCPQWVVNLAAGRGLLETQFGPMNVYFLLYGINWYRVTELKLPDSALAIVAGDPLLFLKKYALSFWSFKLAWLPPLLAAALEQDKDRRRIFLAAAAWTLIYFALFSATTSGRQIILALPFAMLGLGGSFKSLWERLSALGPAARFTWRLACGAGAALLLALLAYRDLGLLAEKARQRDLFRNLENHVVAAGAKSAAEVFTSDYDLYFRSLPPFVPNFNGGAPRWGTYRYNQAFPEFPVDSPAAFVEACLARGVRFVILHPESGDLSEPLGSLYQSRAPIVGLEPKAEFGAHRVYAVLDAGNQ